MSIIKSYQIDGNDLYLEVSLNWSFEPNLQEAVEVWKLSNVDKVDLGKKKLDALISYEEDADIEQESIAEDRTRLKISTFLDQKDYFFTCDNVTSYRRPYNIQELTSFIINQQQTYQDQEEIIRSQSWHFNELTKFIEKEIDRKRRIGEQISDPLNHSYIKAKYQLEILNQIKTFVDKTKNT